MNSGSTDSIKFGDFVATVTRRPLLWIAPTLLLFAASLCYALLRTPRWEASQTLLVRNEATSGSTALGKFEGLDSMKNAQETLLEIARSRSVVQTALEQLVLEARGYDAKQPTAREVASTRDRISIEAPQGVEFGRSEVIHVVYADTERQRALDFNRILGEQLDQRMRALRDQKAESLVAELSEAATIARTDLAAATGELAALEASVGADLAELRSLNEAAGGTSNLRLRQNQLENELRQAKLASKQFEQLYTVLVDMQNDPQQLLGTPSALLQSQPNLQRLKAGLIDAQLRTAQLSGSMSAEHPLVIGALQAEAETQQRVRAELATAISGVQIERNMAKQQADDLEAQLMDVRVRMRRIAGLRAQYHNLANEVSDRSEILRAAQQQLAAARSSRAAAHSSSVLTQIDPPSTGADPAGPRKAIIVLAGLIAGFASGMGLVFLVTTPDAGPGLADPAFAPARQADTVQNALSHDPLTPQLGPITPVPPVLSQWAAGVDQWRNMLQQLSRFKPSQN